MVPDRPKLKKLEKPRKRGQEHVEALGGRVPLPNVPIIYCRPPAPKPFSPSSCDPSPLPPLSGVLCSTEYGVQNCTLPVPGVPPIPQ